jgi:hypothetical protein
MVYKSVGNTAQQRTVGCILIYFVLTNSSICFNAVSFNNSGCKK